MSHCWAIKRDGTRCSASVGPGVEWCYNHDPTRADERRRNASGAGRSRPNRELSGIKQQLQRIADDMLDGSIEPKRGAIAVQALSAMTRALEQERRVKETE
jgi:hypothetical protein